MTIQEEEQAKLRQALKLAWSQLVLFVLVVFVAKTFISFVSVNYFRLKLDGQDIWHTYATDFGLAFMLAAGLWFTQWLLRRYKHSHSLSRLIRFSWYAMALSVLLMSLLYALIAYVYFEWGSYIEPAHVVAMRMAGVGPEAADLFLRWRTLLAFIAFLGVLVLSIYAANYTASRWRMPWLIGTLAVVLLPFAATMYLPISQPHRVAPSVQSPLLMLLRPRPGPSFGLDVRDLMARLGDSDYSPYRPSSNDLPVKAQYRHLEGVLAGKNVVFVVMESVRLQNVGLYGYSRDTMPTLSKLAEQALVFHQAYVTQPRSSKAFVAMGMGMTPDPRLIPIAWESTRIRGADSLINRLIDDTPARRYFMGTAQPAGSDKVDDFFTEVADGRVDELATFETIAERADFTNADDGLMRSFLDWTKLDSQPFLGVLWTECAHVPYEAPTKPFGEEKLIDRYDNCLFTVDSAIKTLAEGLKAQGKYDDTVLVLLGDHGEALGEKFDRGHGSYLYEHSLRIPLLVMNADVFSQRKDIHERFLLKDFPATLLYLLGMPTDLHDSVNAFSEGRDETLYFSNVFQDFKLGLLRGQEKFVYRPTYDLFYYYDLVIDPDENKNAVNRLAADEIAAMKKEMLSWYRYHVERINRDYPKSEQTASELQHLH